MFCEKKWTGQILVDSFFDLFSNESVDIEFSVLWQAKQIVNNNVADEWLCQKYLVVSDKVFSFYDISLYVL